MSQGRMGELFLVFSVFFFLYILIHRICSFFRAHQVAEVSQKVKNTLFVEA